MTLMFHCRWGPGVSREGVEAALDEARDLFLLDPTIKVGNQIDFADRGALDTVDCSSDTLRSLDFPPRCPIHLGRF